MLQFVNKKFRVTRGSHKDKIVKVLSHYFNRKDKLLLVTDFLLVTQDKELKKKKRRLVLSPYNLSSELS